MSFHGNPYGIQKDLLTEFPGGTVLGVLDKESEFGKGIADTRFVEGNAYGHMILELPNDENQIQAVLRFLDANHINYEED